VIGGALVEAVKYDLRRTWCRVWHWRRRVSTGRFHDVVYERCPTCGFQFQARVRP
jgi:hypothetical protein